MTWVKVCGLRTTRDVEAAQDAGADAVGLNLVPDSPRRVDEDHAKGLAAVATIPVIILTLDLAADAVLDLLARIGAHGAQPYGANAEEASLAVAGAGGMALLPTRVRGPIELSRPAAGVVPLLDAYSPDSLGGSGTQVRSQWLPEGECRYVLAGGLAPGNVAGIIRRSNPWGVDASSGLESSLGVKDLDLIRSFIEKAKTA